MKVNFQKNGRWQINVIPLPKVHPLMSICKDIRPISLTPIASKAFVMQWVDDAIVSQTDPEQFDGLSGTSTTDALVEMTHTWYESTDSLNVCVRVVLLDFSKAFDLINHSILLEKLQTFGITAQVLRWLAAFLLDRTQQVK